MPYAVYGTAQIWPFSSWPLARMLLLNLAAYGRARTRESMLTIWCCWIRPWPSVKGIVNTSGSVPAARAAVNVGAVQLYSMGSTVTHGYLASNSLIWRFSASVASSVAPGRSTPSEMVTGLWLTVLAELLGFVEPVAPAVAVGVLVGELQALTVAMTIATI